MSQIQLPNSDEFARKRYLGERKTYREFAQIVTDLAHGNETLNQRPLNWAEIAEKFQCDVKFVYQLRDLAIHLKLLEVVDGKYKKPDVIKQEYHISKDLEAFMQIPEIKTWFKFMEHSKLGGTLKGRNGHLNKFKTICDTLKVHPQTFISAGNTQAVIVQCEEYLLSFIELHKNLKSTVQITKKTKSILQRDCLQRKDYLEFFRYTYAQPFLSFLKAFKYGVPAGSSQVFAQSIKAFHAKYSNVALTPEQFTEAKNYLIEKYGIDSDVFRWFMFGVESCARHKAILNAPSFYEKGDLHGKLAYFIDVVESKTEHLNSGVWTKFITIPELQQSIDAVCKRSSFLIEDRSKSGVRKIANSLKKLYKHLHIDKKWLRYIDDDTTGYAMNHHTHALRHFGCQLWLQRLGFAGIGLVTIIGGWNSMDEAKASYGQPSKQHLLNEIAKVWSENGWT